MSRFSMDLFADSQTEPSPDAFLDNEPLLFGNESNPRERNLNVLSSKVSRKPRDLMAHLKRIFFCYQNALAEPLYASILDFLIVLNGKGREISLRVIHGSRSQLHSYRTSEIKRALSNPHQAPGNRYSLFTSGISGTTHLIEISQGSEEQHDYLALANDFIEFSQLEEAMSVLEQGLDRYPERQDLQAALLELYKSTDSRDRFRKAYKAIKAESAPLIDDWRRLADFFDGKLK
ncbi:tetratricopeptide repeat protein [Methylomonas sp. MgM2]